MKTFIILVVLVAVSCWIAHHFTESIEAVSAIGGEADFSFTRKIKLIFAALIAALIGVIGLLSYPFPKGTTMFTIIITLALAVIFIKFLRNIPTIETSLIVMVVALVGSSLMSGKLSTTDEWGWCYFLTEIAIVLITLGVKKLNIDAFFSDSSEDSEDDEEEEEDYESDEEDSADDESTTFFETLGDTWSRLTDGFMSVTAGIDWMGIFSTVLKIAVILGLCSLILFGFHMAELKFDFLPPYNH